MTALRRLLQHIFWGRTTEESQALAAAEERAREERHAS